jgi:hypothetical protein
MDFAVRDELPWTPRGRLLRRTHENAVILARTVSAPLGWRRKKAQQMGKWDRVWRVQFAAFSADFELRRHPDSVP